LNTKQVAIDEPGDINKFSYSQTIKNNCEAILIVRPTTNEENSSKDTKKNIKNKIDITQMAVGIIKIKAANGAVVLGCQNASK